MNEVVEGTALGARQFGPAIHCSKPQPHHPVAKNLQMVEGELYSTHVFSVPE
jgi:hypothetical protein